MNSQATMTAAVWHGRKDIRLEQVPLPGAPQPGWVQIRVHWCGICGSDLHEYLAGPVFMPASTAASAVSARPASTTSASSWPSRA